MSRCLLCPVFFFCYDGFIVFKASLELGLLVAAGELFHQLIDSITGLALILMSMPRKRALIISALTAVDMHVVAILGISVIRDDVHQGL
jgi:hypothetical protein